MASQSKAKNARRAAIGSFVGTTVEYYDFFIYGTASALIFAPQFFPEFSPAAGVLASFAVFGVGFIARPLGAIVMGHFGDKVGRRSMLVLSMIMVGLGTFLIGFLPNYAAIGIWAPIALVILRLIQGFGVGGEWSAATLTAVEHAPKQREALWAAIPQMGVSIGLVLANAVFILASASGVFSEWLWRVPFLLSGVLIFVGLYIRLGLDETPAFVAIGDAKRRAPLIDVIKEHPRSILIAAGLPVASIMLTYVHSTFGLSYMTGVLGASSFNALLAVMFGSLINAAVLPVVGLICDQTKRPATVFLCGSAVLAVGIIVYFPLLNSGVVPLFFCATGLLNIGIGTMFGTSSLLITQLFPAEVRFSGSAVGYQIATLVGGGPAPFVAAAIWVGTASWLGIAGYMFAALIVSALAGVFLQRRLIRRTRTQGACTVLSPGPGSIATETSLS